MFTRDLSLLFILIFILTACDSNPDFQFINQGRAVPDFSADSAYLYVEKQLSFGPRVPDSEAHLKSLLYFRDYFQKKAGTESVYIQSFDKEVYGDTLKLYNVLVSFGNKFNDRILLAAHWDSRPRSENDPLSPDLPVPGADDGASGVAVLMELARVFSEDGPPLGVDIILFDGEDYGRAGDLDNYFLGSRYWSQHPPVPGYQPRFGILLDMVGGKNALFPKEGYSMRYAPNLVDEIWSIGNELGYGDLFVDRMGGKVADDHYIVHQITGIPMINIINHSVSEGGQVQFADYWHTRSDDLEQIDPATLRAVGDVLLELIYNRIPK